jgi:membrane protein required for beta-lactamase induction
MAQGTNRFTWWATLLVVLFVLGRGAVAVDHWSYVTAASVPSGLCAAMHEAGDVFGCAAVWTQGAELWSTSVLEPFLPPFSLTPDNHDVLSLVEWLPIAFIILAAVFAIAGAVANLMVRTTHAAVDTYHAARHSGRLSRRVSAYSDSHHPYANSQQPVSRWLSTTPSGE